MATRGPGRGRRGVADIEPRAPGIGLSVDVDVPQSEQTGVTGEPVESAPSDVPPPPPVAATTTQIPARTEMPIPTTDLPEWQRMMMQSTALLQQQMLQQQQTIELLREQNELQRQ